MYLYFDDDYMQALLMVSSRDYQDLDVAADQK